jgi:hypothetical protein
VIGPSVSVRRGERHGELRWFLLGYGVPFVVLYGAALLTARSSLPLWRRALTGEDACPYYACFVLPAIVYVPLRAIGLLIEVVRRRKQSRPR